MISIKTLNYFTYIFIDIIIYALESTPLYHLPSMTLLAVLIFSINPMIYVLDQLQEHAPSYWNNR
jgi:hypothetical protein